MSVTIRNLVDAAAEVLGHREFTLVGVPENWSLDPEGPEHHDAIQLRAEALAAVPDIEPYRAAIQAHVDAAAQGRNYGDGALLASYVTSTIPQWQAEAVTFVAWRDAVWVYTYAELDKALNGEREQPSVEDFIGELPVISWPE